MNEKGINAKGRRDKGTRDSQSLIPNPQSLHWGIIALLLLATFLRFHLLDGQSFWNDEGNTARLSERSFQLIVEGTASDIHPPLYYLLLRVWRVFVGETEFALRSFSAFTGIFLVAMGYKISLIGFGRLKLSFGDGGRSISAVPLLTALFLAVNPVLVYYSQEARMYSLLGMLAVGSWLFVVDCWKLGFNAKRVIGLIVLLTMGLYTHYFFPVVLLVLGIWVVFVFWRQWKKLAVLVGGMITAVLLYLPWIPIMLRSLGGGERSSEASEFFFKVFQFLVSGHTATPNGSMLAGLLILLLLGVVFLYQHGKLPWVFGLLLGIYLPIEFMFYMGATADNFLKFLVIVIAPLATLASLGVTFAWHVGQRLSIPRIFTALMLIWVITGNVTSLQKMYTDPTVARADYRGMAAQIEADAHPNYGVILNGANQWETFTYYHKNAETVYPIPRGFPVQASIEAELDGILAAHDRLYALYWGDTQRDPQKFVETYLDANAFKATEAWVQDVRFVTYAVPSAPANEPTEQFDVLFGEQILLEGIAIADRSLQANEIVETTLFWSTASQIESRYKVFLHVINGQGQLVAQRDSEPGGGLVLTTTWSPNEQIIDKHGVLLPADLPTGDYELFVGLYDAISQERLKISGSGGATTVSLGGIVVK